MSAGKGDAPRAVNGEVFRRNFEMVFPTKTKRQRMSDLTITIKGSSWARVTRERDEAREAFTIATSKCVDAQQRLREMEDQRDFAMSEMERLQRERDEAREQLRLANIDCFSTQAEVSEAREENLEQARLLAMSADREEKLRTALQRITECDMRWSKKVAREALQ